MIVCRIMYYENGDGSEEKVTMMATRNLLRTHRDDESNSDEKITVFLFLMTHTTSIMFQSAPASPDVIEVFSWLYVTSDTAAYSHHECGNFSLCVVVVVGLGVHALGGVLSFSGLVLFCCCPCYCSCFYSCYCSC